MEALFNSESEGRMKFRLPIVLGVLAGAAFPAPAALGQTLDDALKAAYLNNPTLLAQRAKVRSVDEQLPQALSDWRPSLELEHATSSKFSKNNTSVEDKQRQHRDPRTTTFTISQSLYAGGQTTAAISEAKNKIQAERANLASVEQTVLLDAVSVYINLFRDQAVLELNTGNERVLKRQLEATRDRFEVGEITRTDVHQAEARLAGATADRIQAEGNLVASRAAYRNVIGEIPGKLAPPAPPLNPPVSPADAVKSAVTGNPDVIEAEFDERALLDNVEETRGGLLPSIDFTGTASRAFQSSTVESRVDSYEAKVTLTVPLYQTGSVYSSLREARQDAAEQSRKVDQARRDATEAATRTWEALQTARARIESFDTQIKSAEVALEGVEREAAVGSRTVLDVLDAEQELLDARVSLVRAERDEVVAGYQLRSAVGQLTAESLQLPVKKYDINRNYRRVRDKWFGLGVVKE